jgi:hypothetical protein
MDGQVQTFPVRANEKYFLFSQMTNEKEADELRVQNESEYRFQAPIMPLSYVECIDQIIPLKEQLNLKNEDYHMQAFSSDGASIKNAIMKAWSETEYNK